MLSQRLRSLSILDAAPYLHAGYRCGAACAFIHLYTSFLNWRHGETCAKDNKLYSLWGDNTTWKLPGQYARGKLQLAPTHPRRVGPDGSAARAAGMMVVGEAIAGEEAITQADDRAG